VLVAPFARIVGRPIARLRGMPGHLARVNAGRCPKRTAATAGALTIGVALVGLNAILAASVKASIDEMVATGVRADLVVDSNGVGFGGLDRSLSARLQQLPQVAAVSGMSVASAEVAGDVMAVTGVDSAELETLLDLGAVEGSVAGQNGSGLGVEQFAVNADLAAERGWEIGSAVPVTLADGLERTLTVGAIVEDPYIGLPTIVDAALLDEAGVTAFDLQVFVGLRDSTDTGDGVAAVSAVVAEFPQADLLDPAGFADNRAATVDPLLGVIYALLGFAVLIAALGIMNTLALSIMERTRELGVLRAIGASQAQVRTLVRWEAVLIAGFGTLLGLLIGTGFGWSIVRALESDGITTLVVPVSQLGLIAGMAAVTGVLAAVVPGRRAARLDVLDALRS
jgi:putative ABC transport system permease protein